MKIIERLLYIIGLFGSVPIFLSAFNIQRDFVQAHIYYFLIPLWIAIIGLFILKKYKNRQIEKEMRS